MDKNNNNTFRDGFKSGLGWEIGKKVGAVIFGLLAMIALAIWGTTGSDETPIPGNNTIQHKNNGKNGAVE